MKRPLALTGLVVTGLAVVGIAFAAADTARAQTSAPANATRPGAEDSPEKQFLARRADTSAPFARLGLAVLVIAGAGAVLTSWARNRARRRLGASGSIELLAMRSLGPRHRVALIEVGNRRILVGLGGDHIATLLDLSEGAEFAHALATELPDTAAELTEIGRFDGLDG